MKQLITHEAELNFLFSAVRLDKSSKIINTLSFTAQLK